MRSIAPRAWSAISGSTVTTYFQSRSESRSFSSVIIFMYLQIARSDTASKRLPGHVLLQPVDDPRLGGDQEALLRRLLGELDHPLRGQDVRPAVREGHALARAAALRVDEQLRVGRLGLPAVDVGRADAGVDVALAEPDVELAARDLLEPHPEEHVRAEQDLLVGRDRLDDRLRVPGRAAVVGLGLDLRGRVHVGDDDGSRMLGLPGAELVGRDRGGERAAGVRVRDQHRLVGREDRRGLGHEVHAAEDDRLGLGGRCLAGQAERVADVIGHVLHFGHLVVVGEDHGTALARQGLHLFLHAGDLERGHRTSRETSRARAEWVSAPTEMKSTPVSAIARTVSSDTPPDASSSVRPAASETAARSSSGSCCRAGSCPRRPRAPRRPGRACRIRPRPEGRSSGRGGPTPRSTG